MSGDVIFYGDPHGEWRPLLRACTEQRPDAVVLLGDCDLDVPLPERIKPLFDAGIRILWIPGNHDTDKEAAHDRLWGDYPTGNLHARLEHIASLAIAGLGGVFKERIWYPRVEPVEPQHGSRGEFMRRLPRTDRWCQRAPNFPRLWACKIPWFWGWCFGDQLGSWSSRAFNDGGRPRRRGLGEVAKPFDRMFSGSRLACWRMR